VVYDAIVVAVVDADDEQKQFFANELDDWKTIPIVFSLDIFIFYE
jgi:hypothetical protein